MADEIRTLSTQLAQDPNSLVFLRIGELLRQRGQLDAAQRVTLAGIERHPHNADAHDLLARILADRHDYERAFDEWDMAIRIAPRHLGALKGLAFLYFKVGDVAQAETHLVAALDVAPDDASLTQALAMVRGAREPVQPAGSPAESAPAASLGEVEHAATAPPDPPEPFDEAEVLAGLEGTEEGLVLVDGSGRVIGGVLRDPTGADVTEAVGAHLAGVSREVERTAKLLELGAWSGLSVEGAVGQMHVCPPRADVLLLLVRDRVVPLGRLALMAQRTAHAARRWLERQA